MGDDAGSETSLKLRARSIGDRGRQGQSAQTAHYRYQMPISGAGALPPALQALASEAEASYKDGQPFSVTVPIAGTSGSGSNTTETLTGDLPYGEIGPAGDDAPFTPGDPNAPDAGKQAFVDSLLNFLNLVNGGAGGLKGLATYTTATSFTDAGSGEALKDSGSFSLNATGSTT
jgi:hypothetical protein